MNLSISSPEFQAEYLQTLPSIRERCGRVYALAQQGKLEYFDYRQEREAAVVEYCAKIIQVCISTQLPIPGVTHVNMISLIAA
jgi:hypothetical protein